MGIFQSIKSLFAKPQPSPTPMPDTADEPDPDQIVVAELTPAQVQTALAGSEPPLLLDVREQY